MPPTTSVRTFIRALQTGRTRITNALDDLLSHPNLGDNQFFDAFSQPGALNGELPQYLRDALIERGLTEEEVKHMDHWPDAQKELVRAAVVIAINNARPVKFEWELHSGAESNNIIDMPEEGDVKVVFKSPRAGLNLTTTGTTEQYDITVDVEPSGGSAS
jgi:hypothetical protein